MGIILLIALRLQDADVRQVAVVVGVVEAVADDEFVGDLEAAHVGLVALRASPIFNPKRDLKYRGPVSAS